MIKTFNISTCYFDFSFLNEDKSNYDINWTKENTSTNKLNESFKYNNYLNNYNIYFGRYNTYLNGNGYIYNISLNSSLEDSLNDLINLEQLNWINHETRLVLIEFNLFNPNINLFMNIQLIFEILTTGLVLPKINLIPISLWSTNKEFFITLCFILYLVIIVILMINELNELKKLKLMYFKQFWIYINWILFILSWISLPLYLYKLYEMHLILEKYKIKNSSINLNILSQANQVLLNVLSICSFITTIKLIQLLRLSKRLNYLLIVMKKSMKDLTYFSFVFFATFFSYVQLFYLFYYNKSKYYSTMISAMETSLTMVLGKNSIPYKETGIYFGMILYVFFNLVITIILINIIITVISENMKIQKEDKSKQNYLITYLKEKFNFKKKKSEKYIEKYDEFESKMNLLIDTINVRITVLNNDIFSRLKH